jgi:hypothetical protein
MSIYWTGDEKFGVSIFERVTDRLSEAGSGVHPALLEDALDLFRRDQWASSIVNSHVFRTSLEMIQAGANGILTMFAAGNDRPNFFEISIATDCFDLSKSIFAGDHNDLADTVGPLKRVDGMRDDRSAGDRRKQFVETHSAAVTGGDENSCEHVKRVTELKTLQCLQRYKDWYNQEIPF